MERGELPKIQVDDIQKEALFDGHASSLLPSPHPGLSEDPGWMRCPLFLLHRSLCEREIEEPRPGKGSSIISKELKQKGYKEVVLTGIHLGAYGLDLSPPVPLERAPRAGGKGGDTLTDSTHLDRARRFFSGPDRPLLSRSSKICPHLHIPIQSGDDEILKRMNRNYDRSFLSDLIRELHEKNSNALHRGGCDRRVFQVKRMKDFKIRFELISSLPLTYLHVFPFSRRKGNACGSIFSEEWKKKKLKTGRKVEGIGEGETPGLLPTISGAGDWMFWSRGGEKGGEGWRGLSRNYIPVFIKDEYDVEERIGSMRRSVWR